MVPGERNFELDGQEEKIFFMKLRWLIRVHRCLNCLHNLSMVDILKQSLEDFHIQEVEYEAMDRDEHRDEHQLW